VLRANLRRQLELWLGLRIPKPRAVGLFGEPIEWVDDTRYLGVTLDKSLPARNISITEKESGADAGNAGASPK
jgi:hypothetical protein